MAMIHENPTRRRDVNKAMLVPIAICAVCCVVCALISFFGRPHLLADLFYKSAEGVLGDIAHPALCAVETTLWLLFAVGLLFATLEKIRDLMVVIWNDSEITDLVKNLSELPDDVHLYRDVRIQTGDQKKPQLLRSLIVAGTSTFSMLTVSGLSGTLSPDSAEAMQEERNRIDTYNADLAEWQGSFREKILSRITGAAPVSDSDFLSYPDAPSVLERQCGTPNAAEPPMIHCIVKNVLREGVKDKKKTNPMLTVIEEAALLDGLFIQTLGLEPNRHYTRPVVYFTSDDVGFAAAYRSQASRFLKRERELMISYLQHPAATFAFPQQEHDELLRLLDSNLQ